jgi:HEAT repeat protein
MNAIPAGAIALSLLAALPAAAQRRAQPEPSAELRTAIEALDSTNPVEVRGAIEAIGISGDRRGAAPIAARIRRGLPADLLEAAIDALTVLGQPDAGPVLFELASHRRPAVRLRAVQAIVATRPSGADRALEGALADSDSAVRSAAAEGLGTLGARTAIDALFTALDRRVDGAAVAIGQLAQPDHVQRFLGYLGQIPFELASAALGEMLRRTDLAERARMSIVARLGELATAEVRAFLESFVAALPPNDRSAVRRAAEETAARISQ